MISEKNQYRLLFWSCLLVVFVFSTVPRSATYMLLSYLPDYLEQALRFVKHNFIYFGGVGLFIIFYWYSRKSKKILYTGLFAFACLGLITILTHLVDSLQTYSPVLLILYFFDIIDDSFIHFVAFFILTFLFLISYKFPKAIMLGLAVLGMFGLIIEIVQIYVPYRSFSIYDLVADFFGIVVAIIFYKLMF